MKQIKSVWPLLFNPFERIAGFRALGWGIAGIVLSTCISYSAHLHYHGLLHYGGGPQDKEWWYFAAEHVIVWLIPAFLFYIGGILFSISRIRFIDVLGTVAFAQLPFVVMSLFFLSKDVSFLLNVPETITPEWIGSPELMKAVMWVMPSMIFVVWMMVLMFQALKVSCNLKGKRLGWTYAIAVIFGDVICRYLISCLYR